MNRFKRLTYNELSLRKLAMSGGYWISPDGDAITIRDHFEYLLKHPNEFGLSAKDIEGVPFSTKGEDRKKYLTIAMKKEWIRVREHRGFTTFEFWKLDEWTLARMKKFMENINIFPQDVVMISELGKDELYEYRAEYLMSDQALQLVAKKIK